MKPLPKWTGQKLFSLMPLLYRKKTLQAAWEQVRRNGGAPGVDGETVEDFEEHARERLFELSEALRLHRWHPKPLRRAWIPKPDGRKRGLAIPCVEDRVVHTALATVLHPIFEDRFGNACFAYIPGRNAQQAVERVNQYGRTGGEWVLETDVASFFDTVGRKVVVDKLAARIADGSILRLVSTVLRSGVLGESTGEDEAGLPQGSPLAPLLANITLVEFDNKVGSRWVLTRYSDDLVVQCATREDAEEAQRAVEAALSEEGLRTKPEKTHIVPMREGVDFLGYHIALEGLRPSEKSMRRFQEKVRSLTHRHETRSVEATVERVMPVIRGWTNYFDRCQPGRWAFPLGAWILGRIQSSLLGKFGRTKGHPKVATPRLYELGLRLPYHLLTGWTPGG